MPKEITVKSKRYKCENCGATFNNLSHFHYCYLSEKEVCDKCGMKVQLYFGLNGDYDNYYVHKDFYNPSYITWDDAYINAYNEIEDEFFNKLKELNKKYLQNDENYLRKFLK